MSSSELVLSTTTTSSGLFDEARTSTQEPSSSATRAPLTVITSTIAAGYNYPNNSATCSGSETCKFLYAFNVTGAAIPVESLDNITLDRAPLTGVLRFTASGAGKFTAPEYRVHGDVDYLYAGDEGIGPVSGDLSVRNNTLTFERLDAVSSRLQVFASGQITMKCKKIYRQLH